MREKEKIKGLEMKTKGIALYDLGGGLKGNYYC